MKDYLEPNPGLYQLCLIWMQVTMEPRSYNAKPIETPNKTPDPSQEDTYGALKDVENTSWSRLPFGLSKWFMKVP